MAAVPTCCCLFPEWLLEGESECVRTLLDKEMADKTSRSEDDLCESDSLENVSAPEAQGPPPSTNQWESGGIAAEAKQHSTEIDAKESTPVVNDIGNENSKDIDLVQGNSKDDDESSSGARREGILEENAVHVLEESDQISPSNSSQQVDSLRRSVENLESAQVGELASKGDDIGKDSPDVKSPTPASDQDVGPTVQNECSRKNKEEDSSLEKEVTEDDSSQRKQPTSSDEVLTVESAPSAGPSEPSEPPKDSSEERDSIDPSPKKPEDDDRSSPTQTTVDLEDDNNSECSKKRDIPRSVQRKSLAMLIRRDLSSNESGTIVSALETLGDLAVESPVQRHSIAVTGGLLGILRVMEDHTADASIQIAGCRALERLARSEYNEVAIAELGGIETVLQAMMGHFDNVAVQETAWSALWNLTCKNASSKLTLDVPGGMEAIISSMKHHVGEAQVQINACGAFSNLCTDNPERTEDFVKAGGLVAMASALERHWDDPSVRSEASATLVALLEPHAEGQELNSCY